MTISPSLWSCWRSPGPSSDRYTGRRSSVRRDVSRPVFCSRQRGLVAVSSRRALARALCACLAFVLVAAVGCGAEVPKGGPPSSAIDRSEDSNGYVVVGATVETEPVPHSGDAADDAAIWVNPQDASASAIVASDKQGGLLVYDLSGRQLQYLPVGEVNNVDVRAAPGGGAPMVVAGNRSDDSIGVYELDPDTRRLSYVAVRRLTTDIGVYGSCLYRSAVTGRLFVFVTAKSGEVEQWELFDRPGGIDGERVRSFSLDSQIEGCVADDELGFLYIGEENVGIWKYGAEPDAGEHGSLIASVSQAGPLVADIEGLALVSKPDGTGYLIASSQGNDSFAVFTRETENRFVRSVRIVSDGDIDGVEDTDGLAVESAPLGPTFPFGVLVTQDGENDDGNQNFKLTPLERVLPR